MNLISTPIILAPGPDGMMPGVGGFANVDSNTSTGSFESSGGPTGDFFNKSGAKIGTDGIKDGKKYVVGNSSEAREINRTDKKGGTTQVSGVSSAEILPSDAALVESLDVLDRTEAKTPKDPNGGLHGESSLVMKDGTVIRGASGDAGFINGSNELQADEKLPNLPAGTTLSDVEVTIHSHLTGTMLQNGQIYSHNSQPSGIDIGTFGHYGTNIIVSPSGQATAINNNRRINISQPGNVISIFRGSSTTPSIQLTTKAVQRIINSN